MKYAPEEKNLLQGLLTLLGASIMMLALGYYEYGVMRDDFNARVRTQRSRRGDDEPEAIGDDDDSLTTHYLIAH